MSVLGKHYLQHLDDLNVAKDQLVSLLRAIVSSIEDKTLVRMRLSKPRIKSLASLRKKARREKWKDKEAITRCPDLIGARVVCNNVEDVYRFSELLRERLSADLQFEIQDYIKAPKRGGYRALHVNWWLDAGRGIAPELVGCEVQIRTHLQDAWGELTHGDIYKQDVPEDLREQTAHLADLLNTADKIASAIRRRAAQVVAPTRRPELRVASLDALAYLFQDKFGRSAPDYVLRQALNVCEDLDIDSLNRFRDVLDREDLRGKIDEAYESIMLAPMHPEEVFLAMLRALAGGDRDAVNHVKREAQREFREIDARYRSELLSSLPESIDALLAEFDAHDGPPNVEEWSRALGVEPDSCRVCGETIIDVDAFADAVVEHFHPPQPDEVRDRVVAAVQYSGVECGGWDDTSLCNYHDYQAGKD